MSKTTTSIKKAAGAADKKRIRNLLLVLAVNLAIVAFIAIHEFSGARSVQNIATLDINLMFLLLAALCFVIALLTETFKYQAMMISTSGRSDMRGAFECAVLGKYYDNITPLGAGGQPFQMYYLKKRGLSTGASASLPIAGFLSLQTAFIVVAAVIFCFNGSVAEEISTVRITAYIGLAFYAFIPICIILFTLIPKTFGGLVCAGAKILSKMHIIKDYDHAVESIFSSLDEYCASLKLIKDDPRLVVKLFLYSVIYQVAIMSIPFFVLRAFGGASGWWTVFSLVVYIYAAITIIPTPGNAGAAEGSFYAVFSSLTGGYLFWAMIIWRALVYYSWITLGLVLVTYSAGRGVHRCKKPAPDKPLRAAQFVDVYYPHIDGVVRTVHSYAARLNKSGYCSVICPRAPEEYEDKFSYDVIRTGAIRVPGAVYEMPVTHFSKRLHDYFKNNEFDVFHAHSPFFLGRYAVRLGRKYGVPVIATFHSKFYDDVLDMTHSRFLARLVARYVVRFFCSVDEVWACSEGTADTLRGYGFRGEIKVMDNGVDWQNIENPEPLCERARREIGIPEHKRVLLFVGQQIWHKNLKLILDVSKELKTKGGNYLTVLVGKGYDGEEICEYAKRLDLGDAVKFTGEIQDRELLRGIFLLSDLFFFPSVYDNSPLVVREAALMGVPSLLTAGSNSAECVTDGVNGFAERAECAAMARKIETAFTNYDLKAVGIKARETIPVSWDEIVRRVDFNYRRTEKRDGERAAEAARSEVA